jgi:hypothetical protein
MQVFLVIELTLLALFVAKAGFAGIERELLQRPCLRRYEDTD